MTRPLPSRELSINLLREIADGFERECAGDDSADRGAVGSYEAAPENVARQVAPKIAGQGFKARLGQRRQTLDDSERTTDQDRPLRPRKGPRRK